MKEIGSEIFFFFLILAGQMAVVARNMNHLSNNLFFSLLWVNFVIKGTLSLPFIVIVDDPEAEI